METFDDSEVASPDTETQIVNILKDLLITSRTTIKEQSDKMWNSVFWNEDNYRPDKTTTNLNEIIDKLDTETQKKLADFFQKAERQYQSKMRKESNTITTQTVRLTWTELVRPFQGNWQKIPIIPVESKV